MARPFSRAAKQLALQESAASTQQQAIETLIDFKKTMQALEFIHAVEEDAATRGRFNAVMDRILTLAHQLDWSGPRGSALLDAVNNVTKTDLNRLRSAELAMSFTEAMLDENKWHSSAFVELSRLYGQMKSPSLYSKKAPVTSSEIEVKVVTFPAFSHPNIALQAQVAELAAAWQVRNTQELSAEDRYFMDALATTYLPESIQLLASLRGEAMLSARAEELFAQQVSLLHERLLAIQDLTAAKQLAAMEVHTAFLQERLRLETPAERLSIPR